jgi:hypothetical protein
MSAAPEFLINAIAALFPMPEGVVAEMTEDIKKNGLQHPIEIYNNEIIDGRCRLEACKRAGVAPDYKEVVIEGGTAGVVAYIASANLARRHLTIQQRAAIAAELATLCNGSNQHRKVGPSNDGGSLTAAEAATAMKVSTASVERAKKRKGKNPKAHAAAIAGKLPRRRPKPTRKAPPWMRDFRTVGALQQALRNFDAASMLTLKTAPIFDVDRLLEQLESARTRLLELKAGRQSNVIDLKARRTDTEASL